MVFRQAANKSHLPGAPKTEMAYGPALPKSVPEPSSLARK